VRSGRFLAVPFRQALSPYSYKIAATLEALDLVGGKEPTFDQGKMSATGILTTNMQDREGDILEVAGIWTGNHQFNPIALLDHGLYFPLPIGKTEDPDGSYTVLIDAEAGECIQTTYFSQTLPEAEQVYHLYVEGILRGNSIGYSPKVIKRLPPPAPPIPRAAGTSWSASCWNAPGAACLVTPRPSGPPCPATGFAARVSGPSSANSSCPTPRNRRSGRRVRP